MTAFSSVFSKPVEPFRANIAVPKRLLLIGMIFVLGGGTAPALASETLRWDARDASGDQWPDRSGQTRAARLHQITVMNKVEDLVERPCLYFNGQDAYAEVSSAPALNPLRLTLQVWFKMEDEGFAQQVPLLLKSAPSHQAPWYQYGLFILDRDDMPRTAVFSLCAGGQALDIAAHDLALYSGWAHLAATYDGQDMRLYFNGREVASRNTPGGSIDSFDTPLLLGAYANLPKNSTYCFRGYIALARLQDTALSPGELQSQYEQERTAFPQSPEKPRTDDSEYARNLNAALRCERDEWGEALIAQGGATYDNIKEYLRPLFFSTGHTNETLGVHNLLLGVDGGAPPYIIPLADGSRIALNVYQAPEYIEWYVGGAAEERYGSALDRLQMPTLKGGYYPILCTGYTDAQGIRYAQETFAASLRGAYSALVKFSIDRSQAPMAASEIRLRCGNIDPAGLRGSLAAEWNNGVWQVPPLDEGEMTRTFYLVWSPTAALPADLDVNEALFSETQDAMCRYWDQALARGVQFQVPETLVMDVQRNHLIQNLIMRWRYSLGAVVYHDSYFQPESSDTLSTLGAYGFVPEYREGLSALLGLSKGEAYYSNWERGEKLSHGAQYYFLTRDAAFIQEHLSEYQALCDDLRKQIESDPEGLLHKQRHCGDIPIEAYCTFHQAVCWRGLRDMATVFGQVGAQNLQKVYTELASKFRTSLLDAVSKCSKRLPDGTRFVPSMLYAEDTVYAPITDTRIGSYWNLCMPYAFSSGLWNPAGDEMKQILDFMHQHGAVLLGLLRFNYYPVPVGNWRSKGLPGYYTTGYDNVYLPAYLRMLSDRDEADRLVLSFYGKLAHAQTRGTFVSGEGETVGTRPPEYYRSCYGTPCSANNTAFLLALRLMLIRESFEDGSGLPDGLMLAPATPRPWLNDGQEIRVTNAPTCFGPVSYAIASHWRDHRIRVEIRIPERNAPRTVRLRLRAPERQPITSVTVNGQPHAAFDPLNEIIDLSACPKVLSLEVQYD